MQRKEDEKKDLPKREIPLSETIPNAHSSGDGALRLSEDGLVEPSGETIADAEADAHKESATEEDEEY